MKSVYLQIWFQPDSLKEAGIYGRDTVGDPVHEALEAANLGEVYGGGSSTRGTDIAIEIFDARKLDQALTLLRKVLREVGAPATTQIIRHKPTPMVYELNAPEDP